MLKHSENGINETLYFQEWKKIILITSRMKENNFPKRRRKNLVKIFLFEPRYNARGQKKWNLKVSKGKRVVREQGCATHLGAKSFWRETNTLPIFPRDSSGRFASCARLWERWEWIAGSIFIQALYRYCTPFPSRLVERACHHRGPP